MWTVEISRAARKQIARLPQQAARRLDLLIREIEISGPVRGNWPNYGKLADGRHHCHLKKGQPTLVAVWIEIDKTIKLIELEYAGTYERAPY